MVESPLFLQILWVNGEKSFVDADLMGKWGELNVLEGLIRKQGKDNVLEDPFGKWD